MSREEGQVKPNRPAVPPRRPPGSKPPSPREQVEAERRRRAGDTA